MMNEIDANFNLVVNTESRRPQNFRRNASSTTPEPNHRNNSGLYQPSPTPEPHQGFNPGPPGQFPLQCPASGWNAHNMFFHNNLRPYGFGPSGPRPSYPMPNGFGLNWGGDNDYDQGFSYGFGQTVPANRQEHLEFNHRPRSYSEKKLSEQLNKQIKANKGLKVYLDSALEAIKKKKETISEKNKKIGELEAKGIKKLLTEIKQLKTKLEISDESESRAVEAASLKEKEINELQEKHEEEKKLWQQERQEMAEQIETLKTEYAKMEGQWKNCYTKDTTKALTQITDQDAQIKNLEQELNIKEVYIQGLLDGIGDSKGVMRYDGYVEDPFEIGRNHITEEVSMTEMDNVLVYQSAASESFQHDRGRNRSIETLEKENPNHYNPPLKTPKLEIIEENYHKLSEPRPRKRRSNQEC